MFRVGVWCATPGGETVSQNNKVLRDNLGKYIVVIFWNSTPEGIYGKKVIYGESMPIANANSYKLYILTLYSIIYLGKYIVVIFDISFIRVSTVNIVI